MGNAYNSRNGVEINQEKAKQYWELGAIGGSVMSRHNLALLEGREFNNGRLSVKHMMIAAKTGEQRSLDIIKRGFMSSHVTKDEYETVLRGYQKRMDEMKSDMRDRAAAVRNGEIFW